LWFLFVVSGCSALIYEIVWLQLLQLVVGSSSVSLGVLLATFMGGMCLGALAVARLVSPRLHPLRVFGAIELGIGILGIAILFGMPYVGRLYATSAGQGLAAILWRAAISASVLLPPTVLMGASLPAVARWLDLTPAGVSWLGFLYAGNIAGAVAGSLLAGFYLLRVHDMAIATFAAAAMNGAAGGVAFGLASRALHRPAAGSLPLPDKAPLGSRVVYLAIAISGLCALGAEVVWTRLLSLLIGGTVYTFSIIMAVLLLGLGAGSGAGSYLSRRLGRPQIALGCCQMLLAGAICFAAYMLAGSLSYWRVDPDLQPWPRFWLDFARCFSVILPAACLWGASFPLALAAAALPGQEAGRLTGRVYAANTTGAIVGAIGFSIFLIPRIGTQDSQRLLMGLSLIAGLIALAPFLDVARIGGLRRRTGMSFGIPGLVSVLVALGVAVLLLASLPAVPWGVVAWGRHLLPTDMPSTRLLYLGEGMNASIAITQRDQSRSFHINGKVEASAEPQDMRLQRMLGHIPALLHPNPRSVLIVGCGAGVTAGTFVVHPSVEKIVICELEPLVPPAVAQYFRKENYDVLRDPRTHIVYDDARHFILTTADKFDIITSDPVHPWVKGSATLYTREYFELCRRHLNPGGLITQWVPLYQSTAETVKSEMATFFDVFPQGTLWSNETTMGQDEDVVMLGYAAAGRIDRQGLQQRLDRPDHSRVAASLREVGFFSAASLLASYTGSGRDLQPWLLGAEINRDRNLRLQYLAGMQPDLQDAQMIYQQLLRYRRFPEEFREPR
jgi:spermidine synthase